MKILLNNKSEDKSALNGIISENKLTFVSYPQNSDELKTIAEECKNAKGEVALTNCYNTSCVLLARALGVANVVINFDHCDEIGVDAFDLAADIIAMQDAEFAANKDNRVDVYVKIYAAEDFADCAKIGVDGLIADEVVVLEALLSHHISDMDVEFDEDMDDMEVIGGIEDMEEGDEGEEHKN